MAWVTIIYPSYDYYGISSSDWWLGREGFPYSPTTHQPLELLVPSAWEGLWVGQSSGWFCPTQFSAVGGLLGLRALQCPGSRNWASEFSRGSPVQVPTWPGMSLAIAVFPELNCLNVLEC